MTAALWNMEGMISVMELPAERKDGWCCVGDGYVMTRTILHNPA